MDIFTSEYLAIALADSGQSINECHMWLSKKWGSPNRAGTPASTASLWCCHPIISLESRNLWHQHPFLSSLQWTEAQDAESGLIWLSLGVASFSRNLLMRTRWRREAACPDFSQMKEILRTRISSTSKGIYNCYSLRYTVTLGSFFKPSFIREKKVRVKFLDFGL